MKIPGYTLHGDYYLSDKIIPNKNWGKSIEIKEEITLPNGKKVVAHTLSKEELTTIPTFERIGHLNNGDTGWYWTSTSCIDGYAWGVCSVGSFGYSSIASSSYIGGTRLGFHKNEIKKQLLDIE